MDSTDLAAIRARAEAASPAPWRLVENVIVTKGDRITGTVSGGPSLAYVTHEESKVNGAFIAHAREDIPALFKHFEAELARKDAEIARLRGIAKNMLAQFVHRGYPSFGALQSGWVNIAQVAEWRAALAEPSAGMLSVNCAACQSLGNTLGHENHPSAEGGVA